MWALLVSDPPSKLPLCGSNVDFLLHSSVIRAVWRIWRGIVDLAGAELAAGPGDYLVVAFVPLSMQTGQWGLALDLRAGLVDRTYVR